LHPIHLSKKKPWFLLPEIEPQFSPCSAALAPMN